MALLREFKAFIARGSVVDLAVAVVIGAAFGAVVASLVKDVVMPPIGLVLGKVDFSNLFLVLRGGSATGPYASLPEATRVGAVTLNYGVFITTIINFFLIGFAVFMMVRVLNRVRREKEVAEDKPELKGCAYCFTRMPAKATGCPNCTSELKAA
jgi:large conductance mechanosensitive channel